MSSIVVLRRSLTIVTMLALAACGSMKPLPSDTFYRIDVGGETPISAQWTTGSVRVAKFDASGVHRERPIAYSQTGGLELKQRKYHLWADSPERMLQNELASYLRRAAVAPVVTNANMSGPGILVRGRIDRMESVVGDGVVVELLLELFVRGDDDQLVFGREYRESRSAADDDMNAVATAMSDAVGAIFAQFTADADTALRGDTNVGHRLED